MIEVENLTKYYGAQPALLELSFQAAKGEVLGFLGPNAAGKTTTMRILTGFIPATSGTARVAGFDVFGQSLEVRRRIGYLPETVALYSEMVVRDYLAFVAEVKGVPRRTRAGRVDQVIDQCGLGEVRGRLIANLSKGFRQRVGLAQALVNDPEVLILDEPTVGLDPRQIIEIRQLIRSLGGDHTIILSTHILPEVSMTCQRVIIVSEGRLVAVDTPANLQARLQKGARMNLQVAGPESELRRALAGVPGVLGVEAAPAAGAGGRTGEYLVELDPARDARRELAAAVVGAGLGLLEMRSLTMSLEDIFIQLVTEEEVVR